MKVPMSETTSATNRLRKVDTRKGRHKVDAPRAFKFFSAVSVNRLAPWSCLAGGSQDVCAPTVSAQSSDVDRAGTYYGLRPISFASPLPVKDQLLIAP